MFTAYCLLFTVYCSLFTDLSVYYFLFIVFVFPGCWCWVLSASPVNCLPFIFNRLLLTLYSYSWLFSHSYEVLAACPLSPFTRLAWHEAWSGKSQPVCVIHVSLFIQHTITIHTGPGQGMSAIKKKYLDLGLQAIAILGKFTRIPRALVN